MLRGVLEVVKACVSPTAREEPNKRRHSPVLACSDELVLRVLEYVPTVCLIDVALACPHLFRVVVSGEADLALWRPRCRERRRHAQVAPTLDDAPRCWRSAFGSDTRALRRTSLEASDVLALRWRMRFTQSAGGGPRSPAHVVRFFESHVSVDGFPPLPWVLVDAAAVRISTFPPHIAHRRADGTWVLHNRNVFIWSYDEVVAAANRLAAERRRDAGDRLVGKGDVAATASYVQMLAHLGGLDDDELDLVMTMAPPDRCLRAAGLSRLANLAADRGLHASKDRRQAYALARDAASRALACHADLLSPSLKSNLSDLLKAVEGALLAIDTTKHLHLEFFSLPPPGPGGVFTHPIAAPTPV